MDPLISMTATQPLGRAQANYWLDKKPGTAVPAAISRKIGTSWPGQQSGRPQLSNHSGNVQSLLSVIYGSESFISGRLLTSHSY